MKATASQTGNGAWQVTLNVRARAGARLMGAALLCALLALALAPAAVAQQPQQEGPRSVDVPNAMGTHTWFIILAVGGFFAWCISYSLDLQKESLSLKKSRRDLLELKEQLLTEIAEVETQHEAGTIEEQKYARQRKALRHKLSHVLEQLGGTRNPSAER